MNHLTPYAPSPVVKNEEIRNHLAAIAREFQFLDRGFAEYFRLLARGAAQQIELGEPLKQIRQAIWDRQADSVKHKSKDPKQVYVGDLGHFCEAEVLLSLIHI